MLESQLLMPKSHKNLSVNVDILVSMHRDKQLSCRWGKHIIICSLWCSSLVRYGRFWMDVVDSGFSSHLGESPDTGGGGFNR